MATTTDFSFSVPSGLFESRYRVKDRVGVGGTSVVYRALDVEDERSVAIKFLSPRRDMDERVLNEFYNREFRVGRRLAHQNIAALVDAGRVRDGPGAGTPFLVFEWLPRSLEEVVRAAVPKWERFVEQYGEPLLEALSHAHDQGIYHRDVNLRNVRLTEDGVPKLTDFGIASLVGAPVGGVTVADWRTPPFSPKPREDDPSQPATRDVYSFAAVLLFGLTGVDPHSKEFAQDPYRAHDVAKAALKIPPEMRGLITKCLSSEPSARPRTATIALAELRRVLSTLQGRKAVPTYYFWMPPKTKALLQFRLGTEDLEGAVARVEEDLEGEVGILPRWIDDPTDNTFELVGRRFQVLAAIDNDDGDQLVLLVVREATFYQLERARETAYRAQMRFVHGIAKDRVKASRDLQDLKQVIEGFDSERRAREKVEERGKVISTWRRALALRSDIVRFNEDPLEYVGVSLEGGNLVFELKDEPSWALVGQPRQVKPLQGKPIGGEVLDVRGNSVVVAPTYGEDFRGLPARGLLRRDMYLSRLAIKRQELALDVLTDKRALRRDLVDLLSEPQRARPPAVVGEVSFKQTKLDAAKQRAVRSALGAPDIFAVHGPPGTGKTTFITELVLQFRKTYPTARILIASQTHTALDNVLERLRELDPDLRLLRLAQELAPVSLSVEPFLYHRQMHRWKEEAAAKGREFVKSWAKSKGLNVNEVETAQQYEQLAALRAVLAELEDQLAALDQEKPDEGTDETATTRLAVTRSEIDAKIRENDEAQRAALLHLQRVNQITAQKDLDGMGPEALRAKAAGLVKDSEAYRQCLELLRLRADWEARFGHGEEFTAALISRAHVVAATCVGLPGFKGAESVEFELCIIDEASKATPTEALIPMIQARRSVLVGDPNQLPPYLETQTLREVRPETQGLTEDDLRATLLDHLLANLPPPSQALLSEQHRMVPAIGSLISECFYKGELTNGPVEEIPWLSHVLERNVVWFTTTGRPQAREIKEGFSYGNREEERVIRGLLQKLNAYARLARHKEQFGLLTVGVIAAYLEQRNLLRRELTRIQLDCDQLRLEFGTVDAFQGRETQILFYSVTRSNDRGELGFLREPKRLNVALSRGQKALVIVGDLAFVKAAPDPEGSFHSVAKYIETHPDDCAVGRWEDK